MRKNRLRCRMKRTAFPFSLLETLISLSILSGLFFTLFSCFKNYLLAQKKVEIAYAQLVKETHYYQKMQHIFSEADSIYTKKEENRSLLCIGINEEKKNSRRVEEKFVYELEKKTAEDGSSNLYLTEYEPKKQIKRQEILFSNIVSITWEFLSIADHIVQTNDTCEKNQKNPPFLIQMKLTLPNRPPLITTFWTSHQSSTLLIKELPHDVP